MMDNDLDRLSHGAVCWRPHDWPCPLCDSFKKRLMGRRGGPAHREGLGAVTNVVRCLDCGAYYTSPTLIPSSNPYARHETSDYFRVHDSEKKRMDGKRLAAAAEALLGRKGNMLEVGCGRGELLEGAMDEGWSVFGIEMTPAFASAAESRGVI